MIRVFGLGSPGGDDRLGWILLDVLREPPAPEADCELVALDLPGPELLARWNAGDQVLIVDAVLSGAPPGTLHRFDGAAGLPWPGRLPWSSHGLGLAEVWALAEVLGRQPATWAVRGIEADPAHAGPGLSKAVAAALPDLVGDVRDLVQGWSRRPTQASRGGADA